MFWTNKKIRLRYILIKSCFYLVFVFQGENTQDINISQDDQNGIQDLIFSDLNFKHHCEQVLAFLDCAFNYVERYSNFLLPFLEKYENNVAMDISEYEKRENEAFRTGIKKYSKEDEEFQLIESQQEIGLILFDNNKLKDKIKNCAAHCLQQLQ